MVRLRLLSVKNLMNMIAASKKDLFYVLMEIGYNNKAHVDKSSFAQGYYHYGHKICHRSGIVSVSPEVCELKICQNVLSVNNNFHLNNYLALQDKYMKYNVKIQCNYRNYISYQSIGM